jgi:hypothetical protein
MRYRLRFALAGVKDQARMGGPVWTEFACAQRLRA